MSEKRRIQRPDKPHITKNQYGWYVTWTNGMPQSLVDAAARFVENQWRGFRPTAESDYFAVTDQPVAQYRQPGQPAPDQKRTGFQRDMRQAWRAAHRARRKEI